MPPKRDFRSLVVFSVFFFDYIEMSCEGGERRNETRRSRARWAWWSAAKSNFEYSFFFSVSDSPPSAWLHRNEYLSIEINKARKSSDMLNECVWYDVTACMMRTDKRQAARFFHRTTAAARVWTSTSSLFWCVFSVWIIFHFSWNFTHSLHTTASIARHRQAWKSLTLHSTQQKQPGIFGIC